MMENEIIGFTPHPGQDKVLNMILEKFNNCVEGKSSKPHFVLNLGRSWGKTTTIIQLACYILINYENQKILYLSPTFNLAKLVFREFYSSVHGAPFIEGVNKTDLIITFSSGNSIKFGSAENPNSHRGNNANTVLLLDEAAFMDESMWFDVMQPAMNVRGQLCIFISTPNGKNWFWELYIKAKSEEKNWYLYEGKSEDSPLVNLEEIEQAKRTNPIQYRVEYCAEFLDDNFSVFQNIDESMTDMPFYGISIPGENIHLGIDLGKKNDFTCCVAITDDYQVRDILQIQNSNNWDMIIPQVASFIHKWKPVHGFIEINFNDRIYDELMREYDVKNLEQIFVEHKKKGQMVQNLQILFGNVNDLKKKNRIKLPKKDNIYPSTVVLYNELKSYQGKLNNSTGFTKWGAPRGMHDDCVSALLQACWSVSTKGGKENSKSIIWESI